MDDSTSRQNSIAPPNWSNARPAINRALVCVLNALEQHNEQRAAEQRAGAFWDRRSAELEAAPITAETAARADDIHREEKEIEDFSPLWFDNQDIADVVEMLKANQFLPHSGTVEQIIKKARRDLDALRLSRASAQELEDTDREALEEFAELLTTWLQWSVPQSSEPTPNNLATPTAIAAERERPKNKKNLWLAEAMLWVQQHPEWSDAMIAEKVERDKSQLSRSKEYQIAAAQARGTKDDRPNGHVQTDELGRRVGLEAVAPTATEPGDHPDRGQSLTGSKYVREYCAECDEPMKVTPDRVGTKPVCEACEQ